MCSSDGSIFVVVVALMVGVLFVPELMGDLVGFGLDERRRQVEAHAFVEDVEEPALQDLTRGLAIFRFKPFADLGLEGVEVVGPVLLGHLVVDLGCLRRLDLLDRGAEDGVLPGQIRRLVLRGKRDLHFDLVPRRDAHQLLLEAGNEAVRAEDQRVILGGAALELPAVHGTLEIDDDLIAAFGLSVLGLEGFGVLGQRRQSLVDGGLVGGDHQAFDLDRSGVEFGISGSFS